MLGRTPLARLYRNLRLLRVYRGFQRQPVDATRFLFFNRETDNFTYEISNTRELASVVSHALGVSEEQTLGVLAELDEETVARKAGRRLGWYVVARMIKPTLIIETGVHDGLGSTLLLLALERNAAEGHEGRLLAFDIQDGVGWVVPDRLRSRYDLRIGDTKSELPAAVDGKSVGMFIHDSAHTYDHETFELETVFPQAAERAAFVSDNAHGTPAFTDFCARHALHPWVFSERPKRHMYPGAAMGLTVTPSL